MIDITDDRGEEGDEDPLTPLNIRRKNPRQTAVALKVPDKKVKTPEVKAAGRGILAEKILEIAFERGIKVREDGDLAEMLATIEIDSPIPSEAFMAVAEILRYVYIVNGKNNPFDATPNNEQDGRTV